MNSWINRNKETLIRIAFLVPILSVAAISISHVVSWYDLANPISWAIYLSIAVEIAAMSAIAASSVRVKGFSVWFVFIIVTLIQFIGNIYFSYTEIDVASKHFKDWSELTLPLFDSFSDTSDMVAQRRLLALLEGGLLPLISLTCLHFFIKYGDRDQDQPKITDVVEKIEEIIDQEKVEDIVIEPKVSQEKISSSEEPQVEQKDEIPLVSFVNPTQESEKKDDLIQPIEQVEEKKTVTKSKPIAPNVSRVPVKPVELTPRDIENRSFFSGSNIH